MLVDCQHQLANFVSAQLFTRLVDSGTLLSKSSSILKFQRSEAESSSSEKLTELGGWVTTGITSDDKKLSSTLGNGPAEVNLAYTEAHWNVD